MLTSKGIKRRLVVYIGLLADVLRAIPGAAPILLVLDSLNALLGGAALSHATVAGTLTKEKIAGAAAIIYILIALSAYLPILVPYLPYLYKAAGLLSAARVGKEVLK